MGLGIQRNPNNVLRAFWAVLRKTELEPEEWTPREMRHSFVSVLSASGTAGGHLPPGPPHGLGRLYAPVAAWQAQDEAGSAFAVLDGQCALVGLGDLPCDRQPQS